MREDVLRKICTYLTDIEVNFERNFALSGRSSFRIGGLADIGVFPEDELELAFTLAILNDMDVPRTVVGNGTNLLFADDGYRGCVIFTERMNKISVNGNRITAGAGASLTSIAVAARNASLTGLEFAYGIPGSVGGAVAMNAGAYGGQISDVLVRCHIFNSATKLFFSVDADKMDFSYRHSIMQDYPGLIICISAEFELREGDHDAIAATMRDLMDRRRSKQPLEYPSAGSVFKRPAPDMYVGKMIEDSGLKGYTVGGAQISEKHAGFIINTGGATASDVLTLVEHTKKVIKDNYGVDLVCEIRVVGNGE